MDLFRSSVSSWGSFGSFFYVFFEFVHYMSVQSPSRVCLCNPMDWSTPGFPVHCQLLEFTQTHVHSAGDAIQPSHPLSFLSLTLNLSQHQGPFKWVSSSHQVARVLQFQVQHQSFRWLFRTDFFYDWLVGSPCSPRDSQEFSQHHSSKASIL